MTTSSLLMLALKVSLVLMVLGLGLRSTRAEAAYLVSDRGLFARSFIAMNVFMPIAAIWLGLALSLPRTVALALLALSLSPMPPFLPGKVTRAGGSRSYVVGLMITTSVVAILAVPVSVHALGRLFGVPSEVGAPVIARLVAVSVLLPFGVGLGLHQLFPARSERAAAPVTLVATILLVGSLLPLLVDAWPILRSLVGNGTLVAFAVMSLSGLAIGHLLGGPRAEDRIVLALSTCARHPAVAIAILAATAPGDRLTKAAVVLGLLVGTVASVPYVVWMKRNRRLANAPPPRAIAPVVRRS